MALNSSIQLKTKFCGNKTLLLIIKILGQNSRSGMMTHGRIELFGASILSGQLTQACHRK